MAPETFKLDRLRLRRPKLTDAEGLFAIGSDPEVARFANWPLSTSMESMLGRLRQRATDWESGAEYYWVITLEHGDRAIGAIASCVDKDAADFGYLLDRPRGGCAAIVEWAFSLPSIRESGRLRERGPRVREHVAASDRSAEPLERAARCVPLFEAAVSACRLIAPHADYEASHRTFLEEFAACRERVVPWIVAEPYATFQAYVAMMEAASRGVGLRDGGVPHSTFWWVDANNEILGVSNLRHWLTDRLTKFGGHIGYGVRPSARGVGHATGLLRATLGEARRLGLRRVLLTCDKRNVASAKTILRNGGVFEEEEFMLEHERVVCRYWIDL